MTPGQAFEEWWETAVRHNGPHNSDNPDDLARAAFLAGRNEPLAVVKELREALEKIRDTSCTEHEELNCSVSIARAALARAAELEGPSDTKERMGE